MSRPIALRAGLLALVAVAVAGCSVAIPITGLQTDPNPTGSIGKAVAVLSPGLDGEDLRRAKAALAVALDPQGNGARVVWQNPQSGAKGAFTAAAPPFADEDRVCRAFAGEVSPPAAAERRLAGSACREGDGSWIVRAVEDRAKA